MSRRSAADPHERRFIADRMLGTLTRYLRFLGYDTLSANSMRAGNRREDTLLLRIAEEEGRILLTRDRELARRGGDLAVLISQDDILDQIAHLVERGLLSEPLQLRMVRCSLCNERLRPATEGEIRATSYAPGGRRDLVFFWCPRCRRLYWMGSHARNLGERLSGMGGGRSDGKG